MRKRNRTRHHRPLLAPTMVAMFNQPQVAVIERNCVTGLRAGWADTSHFDVLADVRDMLALAAAAKDDKGVLAICELGLIALQNIKDRFIEGDGLTASEDELSAINAMLDANEDFWRRQGGLLRAEAERALSRARAMERTAA